MAFAVRILLSGTDYELRKSREVSHLSSFNTLGLEVQVVWAEEATITRARRVVSYQAAEKLRLRLIPPGPETI